MREDDTPSPADVGAMNWTLMTVAKATASVTSEWPVQALDKIDEEFVAARHRVQGNRSSECYVSWDDLRLTLAAMLRICLEKLEENPLDN